MNLDDFIASAWQAVRTFDRSFARTSTKPKPKPKIKREPIVFAIGSLAVAFAAAGVIHVGSTSSVVTRSVARHPVEVVHQPLAPPPSPTVATLRIDGDALAEHLAGALRMADRFGGAEALLKAAAANVKRAREVSSFELPEALFIDDADVV